MVRPAGEPIGRPPIVRSGSKGGWDRISGHIDGRQRRRRPQYHVMLLFGMHYGRHRSEGRKATIATANPRPKPCKFCMAQIPRALTIYPAVTLIGFCFRTFSSEQKTVSSKPDDRSGEACKSRWSVGLFQLAIIAASPKPSSAVARQPGLESGAPSFVMTSSRWARSRVSITSSSSVALAGRSEKVRWCETSTMLAPASASSAATAAS